MTSYHGISFDDDIDINSNKITNRNCVKFVIWHTLRKLPPGEEITREVTLDDDVHGRIVNMCKLTHDWKIHLDVIQGDPRPVIARIEADFGPTFLRRRLFICNRPRRIRNTTKSTSSEGDDNEASMAWRCFESRQKCAGTPPVHFSIVGMGGTVLRIKYHPDPDPVEGYFYENNVSSLGSSCSPIALPPQRYFSVEQFVPVADVDVDMASGNPALTWENGEEGIEKIRQAIVASTDQSSNHGSNLVNTIVSIQLFDDDANEKKLENMIKLSQNFIKYEDAIDKIIESNRDSRTPEVHTLQDQIISVKSNKSNIEGDTNRMKHDKLASCSGSVQDIVKAMNPVKGKRYKLMFAREEKTRSFVARFLFPAVPGDVDFTMALLRFSTLFVHNSFRFQRPSSFKPTRSIEYGLNFLFSMIIRDRFVEEVLLSGKGTKNEDDDDTSMLFLCNFDADGMYDDDEVSLPISVLHGMTEKDELTDSMNYNESIFSDSEKRARSLDHIDTMNCKRLRPCAPPISNAIQHQSFDFANSESPDIDVVFRSELCSENKYYTATRLAIIGKKLSTGISNNKTGRLERLKSYFDARDHELKKCQEVCNQTFINGILGIEFIFQDDADGDSNNICVTLRGGLQMTIPRRSVCESKHGNKDFAISLLRISETKAKSILEKLNYKERDTKNSDDFVRRIDDYIDELEKHPNNIMSNPCSFVLIHDLFSKR